MTLFDRITEGERERTLLEKLRAGAITPENLEEHCLPFFLKIQIQTDSRCNARCATCPYPETSRRLPQGRMPEEVFERVVDGIAGRGVERTSLFLMNEPLVDPRLERLTRRLKEREPRTTALIFTNGVLLDGSRAHSLAEAGMDEIDISVNGFDAPSHERYMKGIDFARVRANLAEVGALARSGALGSMRVKVVGLTLPGAKEGARAFQEATGLPVYLKPVTNRAGLIDTASLKGGEAAPAPAAPTLCQRPFVKAYVLFNGDMVLCNCDWMRTCVIGNVMETDLQKLWLHPTLMEVRRAHLRHAYPPGTLCAGCDYPFLID